MQMSRRAKRMAQHHNRAQTGTLNLVSLMDIFTILVFFLLVNASEVEVLPSSKDVALPESIIDTRPTETAVIQVTANVIKLNNEALVSINDIEKDSKGIAALVTALKNLPADETDGDEKRPVTLMGDKGTPFKLLKRVMYSASEAGFSHLSLAVVNQAVDTRGAAQ